MAEHPRRRWLPHSGLPLSQGSAHLIGLAHVVVGVARVGSYAVLRSTSWQQEELQAQRQRTGGARLRRPSGAELYRPDLGRRFQWLLSKTLHTPAAGAGGSERWGRLGVGRNPGPQAAARALRSSAALMVSMGRFWRASESRA